MKNNTVKPNQSQIDKAKSILKNAGYIGLDSLFSKQDIKEKAKDMGIKKMSNKRLNEIAESIDRCFDASTGINWDTIETAI